MRPYSDRSDIVHAVTGSSPHPTQRAPWRPLGLFALALLAVLAGVADLHLHDEGPAGELVGHLGAVPEQGETLFLGASHPASAPHAESAGTEITFRCPVCALHLQAADEASADSLAGRVDPTAALGGRPGPALASAALLQPGGPRAPPSR